MLKSLEGSPKTWSILDAYESAGTKKAQFLNQVKKNINDMQNKETETTFLLKKRYSPFYGIYNSPLPGSTIAQYKELINSLFHSSIHDYKTKNFDLFNNSILHSVKVKKLKDLKGDEGLSIEKLSDILKSILNEGLRFGNNGMLARKNVGALSFNDPAESLHSPIKYVESLKLRNKVLSQLYFLSKNNIYNENNDEYNKDNEVNLEISPESKDYIDSKSDIEKYNLKLALGLRHLLNFDGDEGPSNSVYTLIIDKKLYADSANHKNTFTDIQLKDLGYHGGERLDPAEIRIYKQKESDQSYLPINNYLKGLMLNHNFSLGKIAQIYDTVMQQPFYADKVKKGEIKFYSIYGNELPSEVMDKIAAVANNKDYENKDKWLY